MFYGAEGVSLLEKTGGFFLCISSSDRRGNFGIVGLILLYNIQWPARKPQHCRNVQQAAKLQDHVIDAVAIIFFM
jgi:hypothetical protein